MAKKNLDKLKSMVGGWKNVFIPDEEVEALAQERLAVCKECPHKKRFICAKCSCPINAKIRSVDDECPDGRWLR